MSALWKAIESGEALAFWNDGNAVHACEGAEVHQGVFLMWTKCQRDVPAGKAHILLHDRWTYATDTVTCPKCLARQKVDGRLRDGRKIEAVQIWRHAFGGSLVEALNAVNAIQGGHAIREEEERQESEDNGQFGVGA